MFARVISAARDACRSPAHELTGPEVLERLEPLGIEAALAAMNDHEQEHLEKRRQLENRFEQARFEAARAHRQYDHVDPANRLVASELERRWNEKLVDLHAIAEEFAQHNAADQQASSRRP
jgi:hypothetical protein